MDLVSIISGSASGAVVVFLLKNWIAERLKQSIQYEYSQQLESYKTELNTKVLAIEHNNHINHLRTSLFFDHQRNAFVEIIEKIAQIRLKWYRKFDLEIGDTFYAAPWGDCVELQSLLNRHQLFLDEECLLFMWLLDRVFTHSMPYDDGSSGPAHQNDAYPMYSHLEYLEPRISALFREKIGIVHNSQYKLEIAVLAGVEAINSYHFLQDAEESPEIKGELSMSFSQKSASEKVAIGLANKEKLIGVLKRYGVCFGSGREGNPGLHTSIKRILSTLNSCE